MPKVNQTKRGWHVAPSGHISAVDAVYSGDSYWYLPEKDLTTFENSGFFMREQEALKVAASRLSQLLEDTKLSLALVQTRLERIA